MADIKEKVRGTVRTLDKAKVGTERVKDNFLSVKEKSENAYTENSYSSNDYATSKLQKGEKEIVNGVDRFNRTGIKATRETKNNIQNAKKQIDAYRTRAKEKAAAKKTKGLIKSKENVRRVKGSIKTSQNTVKLTGKSIKTSEKVAKNSAKIAKETAKNTQRMIRATKKLVQATVKTIKVAVKATIQAVKGLVTGIKALIAFLASGGWIVVVVVVVMLMFGAMLCSLFGKPGPGTQQMWGNSVVSIARSQVDLGITGGDPYWSWYGFDERVEWCACFVSWCGDQAGLIEKGEFPKFSGCSDGVQWFKDHHEWSVPQTYFYPTPGMIIFFDWENDGTVDHVGIVESYDPDERKVYTLEGNSGDACKANVYNWNDQRIYGYGTYTLAKPFQNN